MRRSDSSDNVWPQYYRRHFGTPVETDRDPLGKGLILFGAGLCLLMLPLVLLVAGGVLLGKAALDGLSE